MFHAIQQNENIMTVGFQEEVRPYYAISNVLILPSYREGFPNAVLQAGAMGLPSIVSDICGCNEIVSNEKNGLVVPKKNEKALELAMLELMSNQTLYNVLKSNARKNIEEKFDKILVWEELKKEYEKNLSNNNY